MNFEIFDDEFDEEKSGYKKEINILGKNLISKEKKDDWKKFVSLSLTNTRNYYLIITALKIMQNLNENMTFDSAYFKALSFMPDMSFFNTVVMIVCAYHEKGVAFANYFNVEPTKINMKKTQKKADKKYSTLQKINKN